MVWEQVGWRGCLIGTDCRAGVKPCGGARLCGVAIVKVVRVGWMALLTFGWFGRCQFRDVGDKPWQAPERAQSG
jgi:hypothetical protein